MTRLGARRPLFLAAAALSVGVVAAALVTQHALGMLPCPWCVLQRLIFVVIGLVALPWWIAPENQSPVRASPAIRSVWRITKWL